MKVKTTENQREKWALSDPYQLLSLGFSNSEEEGEERKEWEEGEEDPTYFQIHSEFHLPTILLPFTER